MIVELHVRDEVYPLTWAQPFIEDGTYRTSRIYKRELPDALAVRALAAWAEVLAAEAAVEDYFGYSGLRDDEVRDLARADGETQENQRKAEK